MSKESKSRCNHRGSHEISKYFCSKCSSFCHNSVIYNLIKVIGIKPSNYNTPVDICPLDTLEHMTKEVSQLKTENLLGVKTKNTNYLSKRDDLLKLIKTMVKRLQFDNNTLHLTLYYLDLILLANTDFQHDLSAVSYLSIYFRLAYTF